MSIIHFKYIYIILYNQILIFIHIIFNNVIWVCPEMVDLASIYCHFHGFWGSLFSYQSSTCLKYSKVGRPPTSDPFFLLWTWKFSRSFH